MMFLDIEETYGLSNEAVPEEMFDFLKVVSMGAKKYAMNNWLLPDGVKSDEKSMHNSMFHHLAESYSIGQTLLENTKHVKQSIKPLDRESGLDPLLHLACRALMLYTRRQRGIVHGDDV